MTTLLEREHRKLVTEPLDAISQQTGDSPYQVFSDWIDLALASFSGDEDAYQNRSPGMRTTVAMKTPSESSQLSTQTPSEDSSSRWNRPTKTSSAACTNTTA